MLDYLLDYPGTKIKSVAKIVFWIDLIGFICLAVELSRPQRGYGDFNFLVFFGIFTAGVITSYLSALILTGFGELIEKTSDISEQLMDVIKNTTPESTSKHETQASNHAKMKLSQQSVIIRKNTDDSQASTDDILNRYM